MLNLPDLDGEILKITFYFGRKERVYYFACPEGTAMAMTDRFAQWVAAGSPDFRVRSLNADGNEFYVYIDSAEPEIRVFDALDDLGSVQIEPREKFDLHVRLIVMGS